MIFEPQPPCELQVADMDWNASTHKEDAMSFINDPIPERGPDLTADPMDENEADQTAEQSSLENEEPAEGGTFEQTTTD